MRARELTPTVLVSLGMLTVVLAASAPAFAAAPETPVTKPESAITGTTATLNGELNPGAAGEAGEYDFAYKQSATECTEGSVAPEPPGAALGAEKEAVSLELTGLEPSRPYTFCVVARHTEGETIESSMGAPVTFETLAVAPTVDSESTSAVTPFEATLEAQVNPNNQETTYSFEYAENPALTSATTVPGETPLSAEFGERTATVATGAVLTPATPYYYRVIAENAAHEKTEGTVEHFTTLTLEAPIVASESFSGVTSSSVTLEAQVNPNYQETTCEFQYGTDVSLATTTTVPCEPEHLGTGGSETGATVSLTGLEAGKTYYYRVVAENGTPPATDGTIQSFTTQGVPLVSTGEAQNMTRTTATLSGTVNPVGAATTYYFEYVSEARYQTAIAVHASNPYAAGETTPPINAGSSYEAQAVGPIQASGLLPGTTYHYALVAYNAVGSALGQDDTFTTLPPTPPTATTAGASGVSQNTATVSGTVSTNGLQTNYGFEIGTEAGNYGPATGLGSLGGATTETVTVTLGELQPGTTYYYRVTATNQDGTVQGAPRTFTTAGFPTLLTVPSAPPLIATPAIAFPTEPKTTTTTPKASTKAQKLANALKACAKKPKNKRAACKREARKKYGPAKKKPKKK